MGHDQEVSGGVAPRFGAPPRLGATLMGWLAFMTLASVIAFISAAMLGDGERRVQALQVAAETGRPAALVVPAGIELALSREPVQPVQPVDPSGPYMVPSAQSWPAP